MASHPQLSEQEQIRRNMLREIIRMGIDPYPAETYPVNAATSDVLDNFDSWAENKRQTSIAGRIISRRIMGNASFAEIQDEQGRIQIYVRRDDLCPGEDKSYYNVFFKKLLDMGDIIGIRGFVFKTRLGEITVHVQKLTLLCKSLRPLPVVKEKEGKTWDAVTDPEIRYRQRYIDLIVNPEIRQLFVKRTRIIQSMRDFLNRRGYLEVETPILQPIYGGAAARPFTTYHNTLDQKLYLRIANELYLKRLIVGGFQGVFEFAKDFRNEGMDRFHNPEFTQVELYVAYRDYLWMMDLVEEMIEKVVMDLFGKTSIQAGDHLINFQRPWKRLTMSGAIQEYTGYDISAMGEKELFRLSRELDIETEDSMGKGKLIDEIFGKKVEGRLIQPTFIMDYPVEMSPLAKKHRSKPGLAERFEAICNGKEIANAFSELNDPLDQRERLEEQVLLGKRGDQEAMALDEDFLRALEHGMPPAAGLGIGIDRLVMILTNSRSIQEVIFFPQMKQTGSGREQADNTGKYTEMGIPEKWVEPLQKLGYTTIEKLKKVERPGKLHQEMMGYRKKNSLDIETVSVDQVAGWIR